MFDICAANRPKWYPISKQLSFKSYHNHQSNDNVSVAGARSFQVLRVESKKNLFHESDKPLTYNRLYTSLHSSCDLTGVDQPNSWMEGDKVAAATYSHYDAVWLDQARVTLNISGCFWRRNWINSFIKCMKFVGLLVELTLRRLNLLKVVMTVLHLSKQLDLWRADRTLIAILALHHHQVIIIPVACIVIIVVLTGAVELLWATL